MKSMRIWVVLACLAATTTQAQEPLGDVPPPPPGDTAPNGAAPPPQAPVAPAPQAPPAVPQAPVTPQVAPAQPRAQAPIARIGALPDALISELEFSVGALVEAVTVQAAFLNGARGALLYDGRTVTAVRRTGEARGFAYVPSNDPQEHQVAEAIAQWLATPAASPRAAPHAPQQPGYGQQPGYAPGQPQPQYAPGQPQYAPGQPQYGPVVPRQIQPRINWRETRTELRRAQPWRLRLAFAAIATPREADGEGSVLEEDSDLFVYGGIGARLTASRYLSALLRFDINLTFGWIFGDSFVGTQGPEGALGGAILLVGRGKMRLGGGVGLEAVLAREVELFDGETFGWLSTRISLIGELGWIGRSGRGVTLQMMPTFTHIPYAERFHPGFIFNAGFEFGVGGSEPAPAAPTAPVAAPTPDRL